MNGDPAGLRGTDCDFRRYNDRPAMDKHHLIWTAPQLTGSQADKTVFKITAVFFPALNSFFADFFAFMAFLKK